MSLHLIIGDKRFSSWSLRPALALDMTGAPYTEQIIWLNQPDSLQKALEHGPTGKVPLLKTEQGTISDSLAIIEYLNDRFPEAHLWPQDIWARAQARSACAQMHSGFFALRSSMGFDLRRDQALDVIPADTQADIDRMIALWGECRAAATESGPYLFGTLSVADAFFAPVAVRLRTFRVALPADAAAYVEAIYQWPAFQRWQQAGLEEAVR